MHIENLPDLRGENANVTSPRYIVVRWGGINLGRHVVKDAFIQVEVAFICHCTSGLCEGLFALAHQEELSFI
jgi:hypothetical protein